MIDFIVKLEDTLNGSGHINDWEIAYDPERKGYILKLDENVIFMPKDTGVLVVGRKKKNQAIEIVNAFDGADAHALYERLVTVQKKEKKNGD